MMKKWKVGDAPYQEMPFPVVNLRLRPIATELLCPGRDCKSIELFGGRVKATFLVQCCLDGKPLEETPFTRREFGELLWEKAYREQKAGKEPESPVYPACLACALVVACAFLGEGHLQKVTEGMARAGIRGEDIILFDSNLVRNMEHPTMMIGYYDTLARFREHYFRNLQEG